MKRKSRRRRRASRRSLYLTLPELEQSKATVLNSLASPRSRVA